MTTYVQMVGRGKRGPQPEAPAINLVRRSDFIKLLECEVERRQRYARLWPDRNTVSNDRLAARANKLAARLRDGEQPTARQLRAYWGANCKMIDE